MKRALAFGLAAAALGMSTLASAQLGRPNYPPQYFTLRAGFLVPLDTNLKAVSNTFFGVGADYTFSNAYINGGETFISLDWLGKTSGGGRFNVFPICINERFFFGGNNNNNPAAVFNNRVYAFVGLGAFLFDMDPTTWRFGGRGGLGLELGHSVKAEATLFLSAPTSGVHIHANALGIYLGYNFNGS